MDDIDHTPLMLAVIHDRTEIAKQLVTLGAHVNVHDNEGNTALKYAVSYNKIELAEFLLEHGARRFPTQNLLHLCVKNNYAEMSELLLRYGENLYKRDVLGHTPIMTAIRHKQLHILQYLLQVQAQKQCQSLCLERQQANQYELQVAVHFLNNVEEFRPTAKLLFMYNNGPMNCIAKPEWPDFMSSVVTNCKIVSYCATPLSLAIIMQKYEIAEFLIKEGVDVNLLCRDHVINALRLVQTSGYAELTRLLAHNGFKYPIYGIPFPYYWNSQRVAFEKDMRELYSKPLSLQSLARLNIRRHLMNKYNSSAQIRHKYCSTRENSALSSMIKDLGLPNMLHLYLTDFTDCTPVRRN